jgi:hypothetical protein
MERNERKTKAAITWEIIIEFMASAVNIAYKACLIAVKTIKGLEIRRSCNF